MGLRKFTVPVISFIVGVVFTAGVILIAFIVDTESASIVPFNTPRSLGDIKIWLEQADAKTSQDYDVSRSLRMAKNDRIFFQLDMNNQGEVNRLNLLDRTKNVCFTMGAYGNEGRWGHTIYSGHTEEGIPTGEMYVDIDFDGVFDVRSIHDGKGGSPARAIYVDGVWVEVSKCHIDDSNSSAKAVSEQVSYIFVSNTGWHKE